MDRSTIFHASMLTERARFDRIRNMKKDYHAGGQGPATNFHDGRLVAAQCKLSSLIPCILNKHPERSKLKGMHVVVYPPGTKVLPLRMTKGAHNGKFRKEALFLLLEKANPCKVDISR